MTIKYLSGDATAPEGAGAKIIVHICNDEGKWGKGFVLAVSKRWKEPERVYREAFSSPPVPQLGDVQFVAVADDITVANLIGQHGVRVAQGKGAPPIRYPAVRTGLAAIAKFAKQKHATVSMPRIGCGLAGGRWEEIEPIIEATLVKSGVPVSVYDLA